MEISIYSASGELLYSVARTKNSKRAERIMGDNYVQLVFNEVQYIPFRAGCYIIHKGEKLRLYKNYFPENTASGQYKYDIKFHNFVEGFKTEPLFNYVLKEDGTYAVEPEVTLTDTLNGFGRWLAMCINKSLGLNIEYVENPVEDIETEVIVAKTITFSEGSVLDGIQSTANTFETEYWFDGNKFHLSRCERDDLEVLTLGENNGLRDGGIEFNDDNADPIPTKIFAYGGERNIVPKFNSEGIAYDKRLTLPDGVDFVEFKGAEVEVKIKKFYDDIYPRKVFKIASVRTMEATTEEEIDTYYIKLEGMDFDPSAQKIEGLEPAVAFQSGRLIGRDFDVEWKPKAQEFKIVATAEGDYDIPQGVLIPAVGDMVILYNIEMPEQYKLDAQKELQEVAQKDVDMMNRTVQDISLKSDKYNWAEQGRSISLGQKVKLLHDRYSSGYVTSRCKELSYPLDSEYDVEFIIGDAVEGGTLASIKENINDAVELIEQNRQQTIGVSRRGWRSSQELLEMYSGISAEVAVIAKGPEAQFSSSCVFTPNYQSANTLKVVPGTLKHAIYVENEAGGLWNISSAVLTSAYDEQGNYNALNEDKPYYVYARCSKSNNTGAIVLFAQEMAVEAIDGYYLFPVGALSSVIEGSRVFNTMYGYTQINGGSLTTGVIKSLDGQTFLDLDGNRVRMGDADQSIDWNVTAQKRITLHNVGVLSDSGDVSNIGVYRGQYNAEYLYYKGDEVSFYNDGISCTYRYTSDIPNKGIEPTNTNYWGLLAKGKDGADGRGINSTTVTYGVSDSAMAMPTTWASELPAVSEGKYLWTRTIIDYTSGDDSVSYTYARQGENGKTGTSVKVSSIQYQAGTSATTPPSGTWSNSVVSVEDSQYLWTKTTFSDGNVAYGVAKQGKQGQQGIPGTDGKDGKDGADGRGINSTTVTYGVSDSAMAMPTTWASELPAVSEGKYLWTRTIIDYTSGDDSVSYTYARQGENGKTGTSVKVSSIQYQAGTSATTPPSGTWSNSVVSVEDSQYLWTKTTFSDGNVAYGVAKQGKQGQQGIPGTDGKDGKDGADGVDGVDGGDGSAGEYYEYRYAKNGSTSEPPTLDPTSKEPDGWSTAIPEVGELEYLWLTIAKKSAIVDGEIFRLPVSGTDISKIEDTTNDYDGIITDNVSLVTATEGERCAVDLGGNANCRIPYDLPFGTSFTLCLWIRPTQNNLTWMLSGKEYTDTVEESFAVSAGTWHHLAFRFSGRSVAIFKDGAQVQSGAVKGDVIGFALYDNDVLGLQTLYDDIRLLNKALSADDVAKVMSGAADELVSNWSTPIRISPKDGEKGDTGSSPALVFRGEYPTDDDGVIFYGNSKRVDCVKYYGEYYVTRIDAGEFSGIPPLLGTPGGAVQPNSHKWNRFGAQFESVATLLLLAEYANIGNFVIKNNCLMSQKGTINGIDSTDFTNDNFVPNILLDGLNGQSVISGSLRNPFVLWQSSRNVFDGDVKNGIGRSDNVVMPLTSTESTIRTLTADQFTWTPDNSGRMIRIVNYKWGSVGKGNIVIKAPSGKYFYENGHERTQIMLSRECLTLLGYGTASTFYGWIVLGRVDVHTLGYYGSPLKVLYQGIFHPTKGYEAVWSERLVHTRIEEFWTGKILDTNGKFRIHLPILLDNDSWHVMLTPCAYGDTSSNATNVRYATLMSKGTESVTYTNAEGNSVTETRSYFDVWTADDSSINPCGFLFQVISTYDWARPSETTRGGVSSDVFSIQML